MRPGDKFYREIVWMHQSGLSTGVAQASGKPKYQALTPVSREAMAAFLYRFSKVKGYTAPQRSALVDVQPGHQFYTEIQWLYAKRITTGNATAAGRVYLSSQPVSREAMAAFLQRLSVVQG